MPRGSTPAGRLAALGFADTATANRLLATELGLDMLGADADLVDALAAAADPDLALAGLARLPREASLAEALSANPALRARLLGVLGVSAALAEHLRRHATDWRLLAGPDAEVAPCAAELRAELLA